MKDWKNISASSVYSTREAKMIVAIYTRVSTQEQAKEGYSIHEQQERTKKFCEAHGWTVSKVYTDAGFSGSNTNRPDLQELIAAVKAHLIDKVVVYKLDRLSRSQLDTLFLIEKVFLANGVDFVSMSENFDTGTAFGRAMIGILAVFAQLEREQIKERMAIGIEARAKDGKFHGGSAVPIGYDYTEGNLLPNSDAEQVRKVFELFASGKSVWKIEEEMQPYSHKFGKWSARTIRNVLQNETYIGRIRRKETSFPGRHQAIIDEDTFATAQALLLRKQSDNIRNHTRQSRKTMLSGKLRCAYCGSSFHLVSRGTRSYYACYSRSKVCRSMVRDESCPCRYWRTEELEHIVTVEIIKLSFEPLKTPVDEQKEDSKTNTLTSEINRLKGQKKRIMELYSIGAFSIEEVTEKAREVEAEIQKKEAELLVISGNEKAEAVFREQALSASAVIDNGTMEEKQFLIDCLIDYVTVGNDFVDVHFRL